MVVEAPHELRRHPDVSLSKLLEVKFSTLFDVGLRLSEGLSECVENFTSNSVENDKRTS